MSVVILAYKFDDTDKATEFALEEAASSVGALAAFTFLGKETSVSAALAEALEETERDGASVVAWRAVENLS